MFYISSGKCPKLLSLNKILAAKPLVGQLTDFLKNHLLHIKGRSVTQTESQPVSDFNADVRKTTLSEAKLSQVFAY